MQLFSKGSKGAAWWPGIDGTVEISKLILVKLEFSYRLEFY